MLSSLKLPELKWPEVRSGIIKKMPLKRQSYKTPLLPGRLPPRKEEQKHKN